MGRNCTATTKKNLGKKIYIQNVGNYELVNKAQFDQPNYLSIIFQLQELPFTKKIRIQADTYE